MPVIANAFPPDWVHGSDFIQIEDEEFDLVSEPSGLIAVLCDNDQGYLTVAAARRLHEQLGLAIKNSEAPRPDEHWSDCATHNEPAMPAGPCDCKDDDEIAF